MKVKMGSYKVCYCFIRKFKVTEAHPPSDVKELFRKYSGDGVHMTVDHFRLFLEEYNGQAVSVSDAEKLVEQILHKRHHLAKLIHRRAINLEDFHHFLFSTELNPPIRSQVHQDMNAPLSHYFIYTGHNSYLTGNQLSSNCSEVPIIKALKRGVRVIELDLWPSKDNVHVLHGRTLTSPVKLIDCLKAIKENAFVASPYPVIITLEDHLTPDLQEKVAEMVTETFGSMLFCPESEKFEELPTPESLKNRILISTKPPKEYLETKEGKRNSSQKNQVSDLDDDAWSEDNSFKSGSDRSELDAENEELLKPKKSPSSPVYKRLIAIHAGKPKGGLKDALKVEKDKVRRLSLSEQGFEKAVENHGQDVVRFTQKNILRIYPKGTRITSSNYKPLIGWLHGAQMVAFNMQGYGKALWLMHGMFRANGGCGYVKKPDFLMRCGPKNVVFNPKAKLPAKTSLKVKIYMGDGWHLDFKKTHFDKYSPPDFYTRRYFRLKMDVLPDDIKRLIEDYSDEGRMNVQNLHDLLTTVQGQADVDAQALFEQAKHHNQHKGLRLLNFLFSDFNHPLSAVLDDMKSPISHYYIYTSHNTYLTGNQFTSDSSVRPIIKALQNGVRGIELDLWPNSTNTDINVCHGRTLTSSVKLRKCLKVIKDHAFDVSDYPIIITFEDHLNKKLRAKVAHMVKSIFGKMLVDPKEKHKLTKLPSPADWKKRIVISTKPPNESLESVDDQRATNNIRFSSIFNCLETKDSSDEDPDHNEEDVEGEVPEYRDLIAIHAVKHKGNVHDSLHVDPNSVRRLSLSEQELVEAYKEHGPQIVRFTRRNILRVYPKGTRLDSSNYNPFDGWKLGAQMVAFNMQGYEKNLWLMQGMFRANNGCGYVKKPKFLCEDQVFDPNEVKKILKVKVYMGEGWHLEFHHAHFDYCSPPDFYTKVGVAGYEDDTTSRMCKTRSIEDDWRPIWDEEFEFPIKVPELALLRIEVKDKDSTKQNEFAGQTCLPVSELRTGIRCVPLYNRRGEKYKFIKLLMRFEFIIPVN